MLLQLEVVREYASTAMVAAPPRYSRVVLRDASTQAEISTNLNDAEKVSRRCNKAGEDAIERAGSKMIRHDLREY